MSDRRPRRERATLSKIAQRYSAEGYDVFIEPSSAQLPEPLKNFSIDMIATRGDQTVVIEVKQATTESRYPQLKMLAEAVSQLPNYRFDFVSTAKDSNPGTSLTLSALIKQAEEAVHIQRLGFEAASTMLLWAATEGALRLIAARQLGVSKFPSPWGLVKNLYANGLLDKDQYTILERAAQLRNAAAHAFSTGPIGEDFFRQWSTLTMILLKQADEK